MLTLTRRRSLAAGIALLVAAAAAGPANALEPVYTGTFSSTAVGGYDPVAYFTQGKPVEGKREFSTKWKGAEWRFATAANLEAFKADPEKYAPQYGGYCSWAVSQGYDASADPEQWSIVDGKLYLNYNADIQKKWSADKAALIKAADKNWPALLKK